MKKKPVTINGQKIIEVKIMRGQFLCSACGSTSITKDANVYWNVKTQSWELSGVMDDAYCHDCNGETNLTFAELPSN